MQREREYQIGTLREEVQGLRQASNNNAQCRGSDKSVAQTNELVTGKAEERHRPPSPVALVVALLLSPHGDRAMATRHTTKGNIPCELDMPG